MLYYKRIYQKLQLLFVKYYTRQFVYVIVCLTATVSDSMASGLVGKPGHVGIRLLNHRSHRIESQQAWLVPV